MSYDWVAWDDPSIAVPSDSPRTARYRRLQSRWRQTVLGVPPGIGVNGKPVGSMLPSDASSHLQWLTPIIADYVRDRLPVALEASAKIEKDRLLRNLLSSQPLCFNVFGQLAAFPGAAARVLSELTAQEIVAVDDVLVEHTPTPALALEDRSAFDAFVTVTTGQGGGFLGIETKYTEPFSARRYQRDTYVTVTDDPLGWFVAGSAEPLADSKSNQLWRTVMLAQLTEQASDEYAAGRVLVLTSLDDSGTIAAVEALRGRLKDPGRLLHILLEDLVAAAANEPELRGWAALFNARYLDVDH